MEKEEKELQEKILAYRIFESRLNALLRQRDLIVNKIVEINSTLESVDEIEKSDEALFSIGSEAYAKGKITDKEKIIIEIGANIALEKNMKEAKETLEKRREELEKSLAQIQEEATRISSGLESLADEIRELSKKVEHV
jgi:prefoldin alpha subunit